MGTFYKKSQIIKNHKLVTLSEAGERWLGQGEGEKIFITEILLVPLGFAVYEYISYFKKITFKLKTKI